MLVRTSPMWIFATCVLLLSHVSLQAVNGAKGASTLVTVAAMFASSSVGMSFLNKLILGIWNAPFTLLLLQMLIADVILIAWFGFRRIAHELWDKRDNVWRWAVLTIPITGMLASSLLALQAGTLNALIVVRGASPLLTFFCEKIFIPSSAPKTTAELISSLTLIAIGMTAYVSGDSFNTMPKGLFWICVNILCTAVARILERKMLVDDSMTLSFEAMNMVNNTAGLLPVLGLMLFCKEYQIVTPLISPATPPLKLALCGSVVLSGALGLLLGWYGIALQRQLAATSMLVLQVASRLATVFVGVSLFAENLTVAMWAGALLSMLGCGWYSLAVRKP